MQGLYNFLKSEKMLYVILTVLFIGMLSFFWGKWGVLFIDFGRELYVPQLVMEGKVLYKEVLNLYGPFSYQLNAFLYILFGVNVNVLFAAGAINAVIVIVCTYLITRSISSTLTSFITTITIMCVLVFRCTYGMYSGYFFPYCYAIAYAFSSLLLSLLFLIYFIKDKKNKYIYLSLFFMGVSIVTKLDFALFLLILLPYLFFNKDLKLKSKLIATTLFLIPSIICWSVLFIQGLEIKNVIDYLIFGKNFFKAPSVKFFNDTFTGLYFNKEAFLWNMHLFKTYLMYFLGLITISGVFVFLNEKIKNIFVKLILFISIATSLHKLLNWTALQFFEKLGGCHFDLNWLPLAILVILALFVGFSLYTKFKHHYPIDFNSKIYILISATAVLSCGRTFWKLLLGNMGNFCGLLCIISLIYFLLEILPKLIKTESLKTFYKKAIAVTFILLCYIYQINYVREAGTYNYELKTEKGSWHAPNDFGATFEEVFKFASQNIQKDKKIIMIPESPTISYFTGVKTYPKYYSLIPHMIESYGEKNILKDLEKDKPDFVLISNLGYPPYKDNYFGKNFAVQFGKFIENNYTYITRFPKEGYSYEDFEAKNANFNIKIYKLKS